MYKCDLLFPRKSVTCFHFQNLKPDMYTFTGTQTEWDATWDKCSQNNTLQTTSSDSYLIIVLARHGGYTRIDKHQERFSMIRKTCLISDPLLKWACF